MKKMTEEEKRTRTNFLQRERRNKLKAEGGKEYQRKYKALNIKRIRKQNKEHKREWGRKLKENNTAYRAFLEKRRLLEKPKNKERRDSLATSYIRERLIDQGFKKNEITRTLISEKRKQLSLKRALRPQKRKIVLKQKELVTAKVKGKKMRKEFLEENQLKFCCKCRQPKYFDDFSPCRIKNPSYASICKLCERAINKQKKKTKRLRQHNLFERNVSFR